MAYLSCPRRSALAARWPLVFGSAVDGAGGGLRGGSKNSYPTILVRRQTAHVRPHTVTAYENRIDGHDRIPGAMVDRTTTYVNAPPSAATRDRVARPVRTSTAAVPAPAPGSSRFSGPSRAVGFVLATAEPSHGALPAQYIGVRGYV